MVGLEISIFCLCLKSTTFNIKYCLLISKGYAKLLDEGATGAFRETREVALKENKNFNKDQQLDVIKERRLNSLVVFLYCLKMFYK